MKSHLVPRLVLLDNRRRRLLIPIRFQRALVVKKILPLFLTFCFPSVSAAAWIWLVVVVAGAAQAVPGGMHIHRRYRRR